MGQRLSKRDLRARIRAACPDAETRAEESRLLCGQILAMPAFAAARTVAAFFPARWEADIRPVLDECLRAGKTLLLPRTATDLSLRFLRAEDLNGLEPDAFGIPAPPEGSEAPDPLTIDLMLLPLCAADAAGNRLGQGGGCYDRYLAANPVRAALVGVALRHQLAERVPADPWDRPLDACATPDGIIRTERKREG